MKISLKKKNLHTKLLEGIAGNQPIAWATIIAARGSTPQVPGAAALISPEGLLAGTLGGGVLEGDALERAQKALGDRTSLLYTCTLEADPAQEEGAICGGEVEILIDAAPHTSRDALESMSRSAERRDRGILVTEIVRDASGSVGLSRRWLDENAISRLEIGDPFFHLRDRIEHCLKTRRPELVSGERVQSADTFSYFIEPFFPLPRLVIAGAGHIGQAVCHLGSLLEFEVTVIDDRPEFAREENLPEADNIIAGPIGAAVKDISIAPDTYIVIVTRGHRHDGEALRACIDSAAAYIGMIGSRTKIATMREQFLQSGWAAPEQWARIHAPIGLDIGSTTVDEIAVSIAAELVRVRSERRLEMEKT